MPSHNANPISPIMGSGPATLRPGNARHQVAVTHGTFVGPPASSAQLCSPSSSLKRSKTTAPAPGAGGLRPQRRATGLQRSNHNPTVGARDRAVGRLGLRVAAKERTDQAAIKSRTRPDSVSVVVGHVNPTEPARTLRVVNGDATSRVDSVQVVNRNAVRGTNVRVIVGHINPADPPRTLRVVNGDVPSRKPASSNVNPGSSTRTRTAGTRPAETRLAVTRLGGRVTGVYPSPAHPRPSRFSEHLPSS
jgi:hypothetical protein